ncbi:MAG: CCA tRNA nucleotidyltransferase [Planctomycetota bacterium]
MRDFAIQVVKRLSDAGFRAVFAGGCVRDMLLGVEPQDYDVATSATPDQVQALFNHTVPVGVAFGVVRVINEADHPLEIEVATFRGETTYSDGRHPDQVAFTDEVGDVKRRDFTINGLLFDPLKRETLDYVAGQRDLERRLIRAIGDPVRRFSEDHLRMLRAVRLAAKLGFEIDGSTFGAIKDCAAKIMIISAERIRDELNRMLTGPAPRRAFELLKKSGLLQHILPEINALEGVAQPPAFHPEGDVWIHTLLMLDNLDNSSLTLALGALFHDVGKPPTFELTDRIRFNEHEKIGAEMTARILARLKYSNAEIESVVDLVRQHMTFKDAPKMRSSTLKRFLRQSNFEEHLELHRSDCVASHGDLTTYNFCREQRAKLSDEILRPPPLITGNDLIALSLTPGPDFKIILKEVEDRQLEGALQTKEAALDFVRQFMKDEL